MPEHHTLPANAETVHWGYWDAAREPVLEIDSGDRVTIDSVSGEPYDLPPDHAGASPEHLEIPAPETRNSVHGGALLHLRVERVSVRLHARR